MKRLHFPPGFLWGTATSAHQIEGANDRSDWWSWEQHPGRIKNGEKSGKAVDHWNRVEEDVRLLTDLRCNAYRFSVEWSKLESKSGEWNGKAFDHYRREIALLRAAGIRPFVTLHHFTVPQWLADRGGWEWDLSAEAFERYAGKVYDELGSEVDLWTTLNEPMVLIVLGYLRLIDPPFPPGKADPIAALRAMRSLLHAHARAYRTLHRAAERSGRTIRVGLAHHFRLLDVKGFSPLNHLSRHLADEFFNWSFPTAVETGTIRVTLPGRHLIPWHRLSEKIPDLAGSQDFMGVNYYTRNFVRFGMKPDGATSVRTDVGWEVYPEGLRRVVTDVSRRIPGKPILITENGLADASDRLRTPFLIEHLRELHRSIEEGVPVEGYFHWSLLDNFEWVEGFEPRFGLIETEPETLNRRPRRSALAFSKIAQENGFFYPFEL